jgi:hypothetical protein
MTTLNTTIQAQIQKTCELFNDKQRELIDITFVRKISEFLKSANTDGQSFVNFKTVVDHYNQEVPTDQASVFHAILNVLISMMNETINTTNNNINTILQHVDMPVHASKPGELFNIEDIVKDIESTKQKQNTETPLNTIALTNALAAAVDALGIQHEIPQPANTDMTAFITTQIKEIADASVKHAIEAIDNHMKVPRKKFKLPGQWTNETLSQLVGELSEFNEQLHASPVLDAGQHSMDAIPEVPHTRMSAASTTNSGYQYAFRYQPY